MAQRTQKDLPALLYGITGLLSFLFTKPFEMRKNMGQTDRLIRLIVAAVLITLVVIGDIIGFWSYVLVVLAVALGVTSLTGFCPLYKMLGLHTNRRHRHRQQTMKAVE